MASSPEPTAVSIVLMAHGAARSMEEIEGYLTHIKDGKKPPPELLDSLKRRYEAIGGSSPMNDITVKVAEKLKTEMDRRRGANGVKWEVYCGFRHIHPFVQDVLVTAAKAGPSTVIAIPMAPHHSSFLEDGYGPLVQATGKGANAGTKVFMASPWHMEVSLIRFWTDELRKAVEGLEPSNGDDFHVIFTAHSLPERLIQPGDYKDQLEESGRAIASRAGISDGKFTFAWQSSPPGVQGWAGPDVKEVVKDCAARGVKAVVVVPQGFICDHLEILYDLDIDLRMTAEDRGMEYKRTPMPNSSPLLVDALATFVERSLSQR